MSNKYQIKTLRDIFTLPTQEQMETCLDELGRAMRQARAMNDMVVDLVKSLGVENVPAFAVDWPEVSEWIDDGKGRVETKFVDVEGELPTISVISK